MQKMTAGLRMKPHQDLLWMRFDGRTFFDGSVCGIVSDRAWVKILGIRHNHHLLRAASRLKSTLPTAVSASTSRLEVNAALTGKFPETVRLASTRLARGSPIARLYNDSSTDSSRDVGSRESTNRASYWIRSRRISSVDPAPNLMRAVSITTRCAKARAASW